MNSSVGRGGDGHDGDAAQGQCRGGAGTGKDCGGGEGVDRNEGKDGGGGGGHDEIEVDESNVVVLTKENCEL